MRALVICAFLGVASSTVLVAGCGGEQVQISPERAAAGEAKAVLAAVLDVHQKYREGARSGAGWRVIERVPDPARVPDDAWQRLAGPRAGWPRAGEFGHSAFPDGPSRVSIRLQGLVVRGYPGSGVSGWLALARARGEWVRQGLFRSGGGLRLGLLRRDNRLQLAGWVDGAPIALRARERAFLQPGRWTQEPIHPARCTDLDRPAWAMLRPTLAEMARVAPRARALPDAAARYALTLPLASGRRPAVSPRERDIRIRTAGRDLLWRAQMGALWVGFTQSASGQVARPPSC